MTKYFLITLLFLSVFCASPNAFAQSPDVADADLKSLIITMKQEDKTGCINCASIYSVTINGDGKVFYEGINNTKFIGRKTYSIPVEQVKELVKEFYVVDFFALNSQYVSVYNDNGTTISRDHAAPLTVSFSLKGKNRQVYDFFGAPQKLKILEKKIFETSQAAQFLKPDYQLPKD